MADPVLSPRPVPRERWLWCAMKPTKAATPHAATTPAARRKPRRILALRAAASLLGDAPGSNVESMRSSSMVISPEQNCGVLVTLLTYLQRGVHLTDLRHHTARVGNECASRKRSDRRLTTSHRCLERTAATPLHHAMRATERQAALLVCRRLRARLRGSQGNCGRMGKRHAASRTPVHTPRHLTTECLGHRAAAG